MSRSQTFERPAQRRVAMLVHSYYDEDPRVRRQAEALVERGWQVDVIGLRRVTDVRADIVNGVSVTRLPIRRHQGASVLVYLFEYLRFALGALRVLAGRHRQQPYDVVVAHSPPDWLVGVLLPWRLLRRAGVVLDLHEAVPELFRARFGRRRLARHLAPLVGLVERLSIRLADHVVVTTPAMRRRLLGRGADAARTSVVFNGPDLRLFNMAAVPTRRWASDGTIRLIYTGALTPTYELDVALRAVAQLRGELPLRLAVYGRGDSLAALRALAAELGVDGAVEFHDRVPLAAVPSVIAAADACLSPTRRDGHTDLTMPTKVLEGLAMRRPVVASRLRATSELLPTGVLYEYESGDPTAMADALRTLAADPVARDQRTALGHSFVAGELGWQRHADAHAALLERLARR